MLMGLQSAGRWRARSGRASLAAAAAASAAVRGEYSEAAPKNRSCGPPRRFHPLPGVLPLPSFPALFHLPPSPPAHSPTHPPTPPPPPHTITQENTNV